jgi:hypothetical protein
MLLYAWCAIGKKSYTTGNRGIAVRLRRTAKAIKRTAKVLPCVFLENARQRAHGSKLHGKDTLPCAFYCHARAPQWTHGKKIRNPLKSVVRRN